jgi:hypothetical protein
MHVPFFLTFAKIKAGLSLILGRKVFAVITISGAATDSILSCRCFSFGLLPIPKETKDDPKANP